MTLTLTIINAFLYIALFLYYLRLVNFKFNVGVYTLALWMVSSIISIYYSTTGIYKWNHAITLAPFIYLYLTIVIYILPILKFRNERIKYIWTEDRFIYKVAIILSLIAFLPFVENLIQAFKVATGLSGNAVVELIQSRYDDDSYDQFYYLSTIGRKLNWLNNAFVMLSMCIFFYLFTKKKRNKIVLIGLSFSIATVFLQAFNLSARFQIVKNLFVLIFFYLLFKDLMEYRIRKKLTKSLIVGFSTIFVAVTAISIFRFVGMTETRSDISYSIFDWLSLYFSEGFLNFNGDMWYVDNFCYGKNTAYIFRYLFGLSDVMFHRDYFELERITHIRMNVFYTMIGDIYSDFGPIGTIFIVCLVSWLFCNICKIKEKVALSKIIMLSLIAKVSLIGFTYYTFVGDAIQVLIMPIFALYLKIKENQKI